ncbi:MAG: zinc-ribbon domain-containing protein [Methanoregula sp.]|uniref:zinc-ribbon domain-containing protein n=1 Tax=Methanoregula sp. TaxID=2052170 RepID=UPI003BAEEC76
MLCPKCGYSNPDPNKFCGRCGALLNPAPKPVKEKPPVISPEKKESTKPLIIKLVIAGLLLFIIPLLTMVWGMEYLMQINPLLGLLLVALVVLGLGLLMGAVGISIS